MKIGDVVIVTVEYPLGADSYKTKDKCGIIKRITYDGLVELNDGFLYLDTELRPATETEIRTFLTRLELRELITIKKGE